VHVRQRRGRDVDAQVAGADRGRHLQTVATAAAADIHEQLAGRQLDLMGDTGELAARGVTVRCRLRRVLIAGELARFRAVTGESGSANTLLNTTAQSRSAASVTQPNLAPPECLV